MHHIRGVIRRNQKDMPITFDTKLLSDISDSFVSDTEWVVITGAPSAGKSSVLKYLVEMGYVCTSEVARECIEKQGQNTKAIRGDEALFQRMVTKKKLELEESLNMSKQVFLDRGMPDSVTYFRVAGLDPNEAAKSCLRFHYKKVFLFDRLPLRDDGVRNEDDVTSEFIQRWLELDYQSFGYEIISVPVMSIKLRAEFIIDNMDRG